MAKVKSVPLVRRVWENLAGQLLVTIPVKNPEYIDAGDFVEVRSVRPKLIHGKCPKCKRYYQDHTLKELHEHKIIDRVL